MIVNHISEKDFKESVKDVDVPEILAQTIFDAASNISRVPCLMTNEDGTKIMIPCAFPLERNPGDPSYLYKITIERVINDYDTSGKNLPRYEQSHK